VRRRPPIPPQADESEQIYVEIIPRRVLWPKQEGLPTTLPKSMFPRYTKEQCMEKMG
jgi:hypothetical protein